MLERVLDLPQKGPIMLLTGYRSSDPPIAAPSASRRGIWSPPTPRTRPRPARIWSPSWSSTSRTGVTALGEKNDETDALIEDHPGEYPHAK
jgi:hypothetical protein